MFVKTNDGKIAEDEVLDKDFCKNIYHNLFEGCIASN